MLILFQNQITSDIMSGKLKILNFWIRRRSHLAFIGVGAITVLLLFFNEDTSVSLNMEYERQIRELQAQIKQNRDSAAYYRGCREALVTGTDRLEHLAREEYNMQKPTEDIFIIKER